MNRLARILVEEGFSSRAAGNLDSAWSFNIQMGLYAVVTAKNYKLEGDKLHFEGVANLAVTTGAEHRVQSWVKGIQFAATYDLKPGFFSVKSQNDFYASAIRASLTEQKRLILRDLIDDKVIPSDAVRW